MRVVFDDVAALCAKAPCLPFKGGGMPAIVRHVFFFGGGPASWRGVFTPSAADDDMRTGSIVDASIVDTEEGAVVGALDAGAAVADVEGVQEAGTVIASVPSKDGTPPDTPLVESATRDVNAVACDLGNQSFGRPHSAGVSSMMSSSSSSGLSTRARFT